MSEQPVRRLLHESSSRTRIPFRIQHGVPGGWVYVQIDKAASNQDSGASYTLSPEKGMYRIEGVLAEGQPLEKELTYKVVGPDGDLGEVEVVVSFSGILPVEEDVTQIASRLKSKNKAGKIELANPFQTDVGLEIWFTALHGANQPSDLAAVKMHPDTPRGDSAQA